jgi:pantoate--beta-alanine ligase
MHICTNREALEAQLKLWKKQGLSIGFVPTMGALHAGHLSLIQSAKATCDKVVCSIFVNPTQFNNADDLKHYPVQIESDTTLLQEAHCDLLFLPSTKEMYPEGESSQSFELNDLDKGMEGAHRPGHFDGVCTIVQKLFVAVPADKAFFGEKDYQQLAIIRQLVASLQLPIEIIGCPTVREKDGLAMSSRNALLTAEERAVAPKIHALLTTAKTKYAHHTPSALLQWIKKEIEQEKLMTLDYVELAHPYTLSPISEEEKAAEAILCIAVFLGKVRLIDNMLLNQ